MRRRLSIAALVLVAVLSHAAAVFACPSCAKAIEGDPTALSFYWSTLFMIAMPYALVLGVGGGLFYVYWNAARQADARTEASDTMAWSSGGPEKEGGR